MNEKSLILQDFFNLSLEQRNSLTNFLLLIAMIDEAENCPNYKELEYLNSFKDMINIELVKNIGVSESFEGIEVLVHNLTTLNSSQKDNLMLMSKELINADGEANEVEIKMAIFLFEQIGIERENYLDISINILQIEQSKPEPEFGQIIL